MGVIPGTSYRDNTRKTYIFRVDFGRSESEVAPINTRAGGFFASDEKSENRNKKSGQKQSFR